jgi:5-methylcytosine-specific restriction enzyme A
MSRSVAEWIGKDDDARPPKSVRARVFRAYGGVCYLSGRRIAAGEPWDLEHIRPLAMARPGENLNRESNLAPALKAPHAEKSATETKDRAKADRIHARHFGYATPPARKIPAHIDPWGKSRRNGAEGTR